ncbi:MAG: hypothetical protein AAF789_02355 [Bacteroidota bacterium]
MKTEQKKVSKKNRRIQVSFEKEVLFKGTQYARSLGEAIDMKASLKA